MFQEGVVIRKLPERQRHHYAIVVKVTVWLFLLS
jgi:hypothetical protein